MALPKGQSRIGLPPNLTTPNLTAPNLTTPDLATPDLDNLEQAERRKKVKEWTIFHDSATQS